MNAIKHPSTRLAVAAGLALIACPVAAQNPINWIVDGSGSYNLDTNWEGGFVPEATFDEVATIGNGGTAFVQDTPPTAGGVAVNDGTLEIRPGGTLNIAVGQANPDLTPGDLTVGASGNLLLGATAGGTATLNVFRRANLQGNTTVIGPNVDFSAATINLAGALNATITSASHSALTATENASLRGPLNITFDGHTPVAGESWDLVDAAEITGDFTGVTSNVAAPAGFGFFVQQVAGGNGTVARLSLEAQLVLSVQRRTGETSIRNLTGTETVAFDGYLIRSPAGTLDPTRWTSLNDAGLADFRESNPGEAHLSELSLGSSHNLEPGTDLNLGDVYNFAPTQINETIEDLSFTYHTKEGGTFDGLVQYTGPQNDLVLVVDPNSGETWLQNQSTFGLSIDGYLIRSEASSLDAAQWISLADSDAAWRESNPGDRHLSELNIEGEMAFAATSDAVGLGTAFTPGSAQDLTFSYHVKGAGTFTGAIDYGTPFDFGTVLAADFDKDGDVDGDDFLIWQQNFGTAGPHTSNTGDANGDGAVDGDDFLFWQQQFGTDVGASISMAAAVPEPASWLAAMLVAAITALHRRVR